MLNRNALLRGIKVARLSTKRCSSYRLGWVFTLGAVLFREGVM
ncbi:hypothetical protein P378_07395 [Desulforamulus profundi]|uniref:Uncharacterized protein n=1 Tax=Desulforamulus profundi TaxID=1383067 RepID=A0A2C6M990_9FIRM|nr:hypothetical protein P378_07395 [Desulforamulus profundi]